MADSALRRMALDDFLAWEDGTDTRYELIGGFVVAMAPPTRAHGILAARVTARLEAGVATKRPCVVQAEAGIARPRQADSFFVADIAVTCAPFDARAQFVEDPVIIVEVLSPSTEVHDRRFKVPAYRDIETVQEVLLIGSDARYAELHRRAGGQWIVEILRSAADVIRLTAIATEIPLAELYEGLVFDDDFTC